MSGGLVGTITINMGLQLKGSQLAAILRISSLIINAGDESDRLNKNKEMERVIISFGLNLETLKQIVDLSLRMSPAELDAEIISLNYKAKKWISALLIKLIYIGGKYSEKEMSSLNMCRTVCNLPKIEAKEALDIVMDYYLYGDVKD